MIWPQGRPTFKFSPLKENNLELDIASFNNFMKIHSEKSKAGTAFDKKIDEAQSTIYNKVLAAKRSSNESHN